MIERGRSAERMPTGIESDSHSIAPPNTSEAVTGASLLMIVARSPGSRTTARGSPCRTSCHTNRRYCFQIGSSRWRKWRTRAMSAGVADLPAASAAGSDGITQKIR